MPYTLGPFTIDQLDFIAAVPVSFLAIVAAGRFDLNRLAREELANRGHDQAGLWVGIARANRSLQDWKGQFSPDGQAKGNAERASD